ncbi:MAG: uracil-DNA glycosylase family protein [Chloroherpetonaceae bacterium]
MTTFADKAIAFFQSLRFPARLPKSIQVMNPYQDAATFDIVKEFFQKFYSDNAQRVFLWGINPGRFGGGITGIPFTDPFALTTFLKIPHRLTGKRELSSEFIYRVVEKWGGAKKFYGAFYINSLSPLGFTRFGKNYNFYDDAALMKACEPFIAKCIAAQLEFGANPKTAICLGTGKLYDVFSRLNDAHRFFENIMPIEHPRFIMQYRRKQMDAFIEKYIATLTAVLD